MKPLTRRERRGHAKTGGQVRELLQSVGDAAQTRLRYSSFSLHLMGGKIDEPSRALRYSNAQAHNTKVPGDVAHRTHCVRTTQPPLLNRSSTLHILLPYNGSDIASYIAFDGRGMRNESKGPGGELARDVV